MLKLFPRNSTDIIYIKINGNEENYGMEGITQSKRLGGMEAELWTLSALGIIMEWYSPPNPTKKLTLEQLETEWGDKFVLKKIMLRGILPLNT
jgi:hypothetical protein